jgi:hypothetical protein
VDKRAQGDFSHHPSAPLVDKYFKDCENLRLVGGYVRHASTSQDRAYDSRLSGLVDESMLNFRIPSVFDLETNYKGIAKYEGNPWKLWEGVEMQDIFSYFERTVFSRCTGAKMSWMEAWPETNHDTSPGYPVNQVYRDKAKWFAEGAKKPRYVTLSDGRLKRVPNPCNVDEYREFVQCAAVGEPVVLWSSTLKNESRELEKIAEGNLRQFSCGDARFTALRTEYNKRFNDKFIDSWRYIHSKAGIPIQYGGWDWLYRHHAVYEWSYEIDIEKQDSTLPKVIDDLLFAGRIGCTHGLSSMDVHVMRVLQDNVVNSYMVMPDGLVVQKCAGNPSGDYDTYVKATFAGDVYMMDAWRRVSNQALKSFDEQNVFSCCGDDGLISSALCAPTGPEWFSPQSLTKAYADRGIKVEIRRVKTSEASFISHRFRYYQPSRTWVPYPTNCHKAVANLLYPPKRHMKNPCILLARILAQRNRFFADAYDPASSYWRLFESMAAVYRGPCEEMRHVYPADYATAKSLDISPQSVSMLYMPCLEGAENEAVARDIETALKKASSYD